MVKYREKISDKKIYDRVIDRLFSQKVRKGEEGQTQRLMN